MRSTPRVAKYLAAFHENTPPSVGDEAFWRTVSSKPDLADGLDEYVVGLGGDKARFVPSGASVKHMEDAVRTDEDKITFDHLVEVVRDVDG